MLERFEDDAVTELGRRDGLPLPLGRTYPVELTCRGGTVTGRVADATLFVAEDPDPLPAGGVALWADGRGDEVATTDAFADLVVSDLAGRP